VLDGRKPFDKAAADALGWRVKGDKVRIVGFELLEFVQERIEFGVGDLRSAVEVVLLFVMADELAELGDAIERSGHGGCSSVLQDGRISEWQDFNSAILQTCRRAIHLSRDRT
jgi:hypothetical protein